MFTNKTNDLFVVYSRLNSDDNGGNLVHELDAEFKNEQSSHLNVYDYYFDQGNEFEQAISRPPTYHSTVFGNNKVAVIPTIISGNIAFFDIEKGVEGVIGERNEKMYTLLNRNQFDRMTRNDYAGLASISGPLGKFFYQRKASTIALVGNKNYLLHFYGTFQGKETEPYLDVYSSSGTLIETVSLSDSPISFITDNKFYAKPLYLDNDNQIYISDYRYKNKYPALRVFSLNLDELVKETN